MATRPEYRGELKRIALQQIEQTPEVANPKLGIYPYERLENIPLQVTYKYSSKPKAKKYNEKKEDKSLENLKDNLGLSVPMF